MSIERELLERVVSGDDDGDFFISHRLYKDIETFLAQPEQEPVAWIYEWVDEAGEPVKSVAYNFYDDANLIPLYTAPQKREPLSDKEITKNTPKLIHIGERLAFHAGVRFAEKHHGIGVNDDT